MDVIFVDQLGNKKNFLYQYDKGQSIEIDNWEYSVAPQVDFQVSTLRTAISVQGTLDGSTMTCRIPDTLVAVGTDIIAYFYVQDAIRGEVVMTLYISVIERKRPSDYVYSDELFAKTINGTTVSENYGVADIMKWIDGNPNEENRVGYFVNISCNKNGEMVIKKATSVNDVHGVTIDGAGFASGYDTEKFNNRGYLTTEYAYVASFGFAKVIDNGKCAGAARCGPSANGTAVPSIVGYPVIGRVDDNTILVFIDSGINQINTMNTNINGISSNLTTHKNNKNNPHEITKIQVGLGNVPNVATNDQTPTYTVSATLQPLTSGEKLSYAFGKIAKAIADLISHLANKSNPHTVTKSQVGLGNCDNTSDKDKPVSIAQATEITRVEGLANDAQEDIDAHAVKTNNPHSVTKAQVGLGNADNTSDANKPVSNAQAAEFNRVDGLISKAQSDVDTHIARADNPHGVTKTQVGLGNANNTSDADKPISMATQAALDKKADLDSNGLVPLIQLPTQVKEMRVVNTIAERNAIADKFENLRVYVKDATGDATVSKGGADYIYDGSSWIKTGESESLDLVLSWDNTSGKPSEFIPAAHKNTHSSGGTDPLAPADIGAATDDHTHTKAEIGLGNVNNTSDADKPVSSAQAAEFTRVEGLIDGVQSDIDIHTAKKDNPHNVTKAQVGLGNVDNTSDADKPISTAVQAALDTKPTLVDGKLPLSTIPDEMSYDWNNINEKPTEFTPSSHNSTHFFDGSDPLTPFDIGAAPAYTYGETPLVAGTSALETGKIYFVYE